MASGPITSWKIDRETMETVTDFFFFFLVGDSKITVDGDAVMKLKAWQKNYDQPRQHIKK